ncbi:MAG: hypothetical protein Q4C70_09030, partial [Planctomycetia bacterium]|nr:hypothetical protein [Planctomycetia bacterium]
VPVKKVTKIEPIAPEMPAPTVTPSVSASVPAPASTSVTVPEPTSSVTPPPMPNVADPVMYSRPPKPLVPMDVPSGSTKKKAMPLPMGQSTSRFGS